MQNNRLGKAAASAMLVLGVGGCAIAPGIALAQEPVAGASSLLTEVNEQGWLLTYTYDDTAKTATVSGYAAAADGSLTIPATVTKDGVEYSVTAIGDSAFLNCTDLTAVVMPASITSLGDATFRGCSNLSVVTVAGATGNTLPAVSSIPKRCFLGCQSLTSLVIPEGVESVGAYGLDNTGLTSLSLPTTCRTFGEFALANNSALASIDFTAETLDTIGYKCFQNDTSLTELYFPQLTGLTGSTNTSFANFQGGSNSDTFSGCTSLETIIFDTNNVGSGCNYYFYGDQSYFSGCTSLKNVVWYGFLPGTVSGAWHGNAGYGISSSNAGSSNNGNAPYFNSTRYYSIYFYSSLDAYESLSIDNADCRLVYPSTTTFSSLFNGTADESTAWRTSDSLSDVPELPDGYFWQIVDYQGDSYSDSTTIDNTYLVYAASKDDMTNSYIVTNYGESVDPEDPFWDSATYTFYENLDGSPITFGFAVKGVQGMIDSDTYTLTYEKRGEQIVSNAGMSVSNSEYEWIAIEGEPTEEGYYRVTATGTSEGNKDQTTEPYYFAVDSYEPSVTHDGSASKTYQFDSSEKSANDTAYAATSKGMYDSGKYVGNASYSVVATSRDWRDALIANSLAGAGNTVVSYLGNASDSDQLKRVEDVAKNIKTNCLVVVGDSNEISDRTISTLGSDVGATTYPRMTTAGKSIQEQALSAYNNLKNRNFQNRLTVKASWGSTAIVCSAAEAGDTALLSQYAYLTASPVFFLEDDGTVSSDLATALKDFDQVILAGDTSTVSTAAENAVKASCANVTRVLDKGSSAANSAQIAEMVLALDGVGTGIVSVSDVNTPMLVTAAAQYASMTNGVMVACDRLDSDEIDALKETIGSFLSGDGSQISTINLVGRFNQGGTMERALLDVWGAEYSGEAVEDDATDEEEEEEEEIIFSEGIEGFVERLYYNVLGREADEGGKAAQIAGIKASGAAQITFNFYNSDEFKERSAAMSNEDIVENVYQTMLGRASDEGGKAMWTEYLDNGMSACALAAGFAESDEFRALCETYGVDAGSADWLRANLLESRDKNPGVTAFASRMYTVVLSRAAEVDGLNVQCQALINGTPCYQIAYNFFNSKEFADHGYTSEQVVRIAYAALLGRDQAAIDKDKSGIAYWVKRLEANGLEDMVKGFCQSDEFEAICQSCGMTSGMR